MGVLRNLVVLVTAVLALGPVMAAEHGGHLALLVARQGIELHDTMHEEPESGAAGALILDDAGKRNLAETNLNWAASLLAIEERPELAGRVIEAVLEHQDMQEESPTRGLFRWHADASEPFSAAATMYLAPTLAHLAMNLDDDVLRQTLRERAGLALSGLLNAEDRPEEGFGAGMWAGGVASLSAAAGDEAGARAAAEMTGKCLHGLRQRGLDRVHRPTYDALRIGGLRWAWQYAADDEARATAAEALRICYADVLQRYDATTGMITGAIGEAYSADYLGTSGVARYLLACDLPSALAATKSATPLAMYFALSDYAPPAELLSVAESGSARAVRTRTPDSKGVSPERTSTCTWTSDGLSLGTMSGPVATSSIPILATCDLAKRPTSYFYVYGGGATVHSAQTGGVAICSFDFDNVGVERRIQVGVKGILGRRDQIDRVLVDKHEWIGKPEALGQNVVVAVRRGSSFLGIKLLDVGPPKKKASARKPGRLEWFAEGNMDSLMLTIAGRGADYPLPKPLFDVRVGLLVEVAPAARFGGLSDFAEHVARRRVSQSVREEKKRVDEEQERQIPGRHEIKSVAEMKFARLLHHEMALQSEELPLGLVEEMLRNRLVSRTLPTELPANYLWLSEALSMGVGGEPIDRIGETPEE